MVTHGICDVTVLLGPLTRAKVALECAKFADRDADIQFLQHAQDVLSETALSLRAALHEDQLVTATARMMRVAAQGEWSTFDSDSWDWKIQPNNTFERQMIVAALDELRVSFTDFLGPSKKRSASEMIDMGLPDDKTNEAARLLFLAIADQAGVVEQQIKKLSLGPKELREFSDLKDSAENVLKGGVAGPVVHTATGGTSHDTILALFARDSKATNVISLEDGVLVQKRKKMDDAQHTVFRWSREVDAMLDQIESGHPMKKTIQSYRVSIEMLTQFYTWPVIKKFLAYLSELRECGMEISLDPMHIQTLFHTLYTSNAIEVDEKKSYGKSKKPRDDSNGMYDSCKNKGLCFQYNQNKCTRSTCKFDHVCVYCGGKHAGTKCIKK